MKAEEFTRIRKALRLNQSELGRELDFTQQYVSELERGLRPIQRTTELALRYLESLSQNGQEQKRE